MDTFENALGLVRFGHIAGRGHGTGLFLIGLAFAAILIWAITRPQRSQSMNS